MMDTDRPTISWSRILVMTGAAAALGFGTVRWWSWVISDAFAEHVVSVSNFPVGVSPLDHVIITVLSGLSVPLGIVLSRMASAISDHPPSVRRQLLSMPIGLLISMHLGISMRVVVIASVVVPTLLANTGQAQDSLVFEPWNLGAWGAAGLVSGFVVLLGINVVTGLLQRDE